MKRVKILVVPVILLIIFSFNSNTSNLNIKGNWLLVKCENGRSNCEPLLVHGKELSLKFYSGFIYGFHVKGKIVDRGNNKCMIIEELDQNRVISKRDTLTVTIQPNELVLKDDNSPSMLYHFRKL